MRVEYKRDMDHNYLILYGGQEVDTASYQVRMLTGNVIPSILKCRLQGLDGETLFYYDITSRQSITSMYEEKKFGKDDLRLLFGGFVQVMEEMGEYLLNPGYLVLQPDYIYLDVEKRKLEFCYLPGEEREIRLQFQNLTEFILPKLDHRDAEAIMLGYGVYRRALEDSFHLENIKEEIYQERGKDGTSDKDIQKLFEVPSEEPFEEAAADSDDSGELPGVFLREGQEQEQKKEKNRRNGAGGSWWKILVSCMVSAAGMLALAAGILMGYLPRPGMEGILMGILLCLAVGIAVYLILRKVKSSRRREETWRKKADKKVSRAADERNLEELWEDSDSEPSAGKQKTPGRKEAKQNLTPVPPGDIREEPFGETVVLSSAVSGPVSLVSREPGELATIYLTEDLTVIGKLESASDAVISVPTVSRVHAKIRKRDGEYYLTDLNSRNGTSVNGRMLKGGEEYQLQNEDEVDFAQARYVFLK